jgi:hypothetical protein
MDTERRRSVRLTADLGTVCRVPATPQSAKVLDVSMTGCRIRLAGDALPLGSTVNIDMRARRPVRGQVVWTAGQSAGIRFDRSLPEPAAVLFGLPQPTPAKSEPVEEAPLLGGLQHWIRKILGWSATPN